MYPSLTGEKTESFFNISLGGYQADQLKMVKVSLTSNQIGPRNSSLIVSFKPESPLYRESIIQLIFPTDGNIYKYIEKP